MPRLFCTAGFLATSGLLLLGGRGRAEDAQPSADPPTRETYLRLADTVEKHLREGVLAQWFPRCVDRRQGGFLPHFREDWSPGEQNDKCLVFQSRMTWTSAEVARRLPDLADEYRGYARHGVDFLERVMWDQECGGFYWGLDQGGQIAPQYGREKHVYGISFAVYALSSAYRTTGEARALQLAQRTFRWLEEHAHDPVHGGYYEALTREGRPILTAPESSPGRAARTADCIGTRYGFKSMNTHIHLLESLTELALVWRDPEVEARLREIFQLVRDRIAVEPGCLNLFFTPAWRPVPDHDSFGHDVETAFLLLEAAAALHQPDDARTWAVACSLVDHALQWGWDDAQGGFYDKGAAFAAAWGREKIWWTQAEGLNALLVMHARFGSQSPRYWHAFLKQWDFLWKHQIDHVHGEWFETVSAEGTPRPGQAKGTVWKAAYHNGRALMTVAETLRHLAH